MKLLNPINRSEATGRAVEVLEGIEKRGGKASNMLLAMAHSPMILEAYLNFNLSLKDARTPATVRSLVTTDIAELCGCDYMLSLAYARAHLDGVGETEFESARRCESNDSKVAAALHFAEAVVRGQGHLTTLELNKVKEAGYDEEEIVELIALIALNIFRSYFNLLAETDVDFPLVKAEAAKVSQGFFESNSTR